MKSVAEEKFYSIDELAEFFNLDRQTIQARIDGGELAAFRIGRNWRISESQIADYLQRSKTKCVTSLDYE